jgi:hypothetical protein
MHRHLTWPGQPNLLLVTNMNQEPKLGHRS